VLISRIRYDTSLMAFSGRRSSSTAEQSLRKR
jgi:hypothetical protein